MFHGNYAKITVQIEKGVWDVDLENYLEEKGVKFISVEMEDCEFEVEDKDEFQLVYCIKKKEC